MNAPTTKLQLRRYVTVEELPTGQWHAHVQTGSGSGVGSYVSALCDAMVMAAVEGLGVLSLNCASEIVFIVHADNAG